MKDKLYFENVIGIGDLYLEHIFLDYDKEPVFFTCIDEHGLLYICLCAEIRGEQRWVISKSSIRILNAVVNGTMDMYSAFGLHENLYIVQRNMEGIETSRIESFSNVDPLDLPLKGTMLRCSQM